MSSSKLDPDELALLEEERDHLLSSLEDLEREHDAGDLDDDDYRTLRDDYTVRASEVLAAIEDRRALVEARRTRTGGRGRTVATVVGVVALAAVAGVLVATNSGQRGGGVISGAVDTQRARLATCQQASFQDPEAGVECYDEILADAPDNVEALTYRGWAQIRLDEVAEGAADLERAVQIDPDYADARVFRAVVAKRGGDYELAAEEIDRFYRNDPSPAAIQVLQMQGLEREVFIFTVDEPTRSCWQQAAQAQDPDATDATKFLSELGECLDAVLAADPNDVDALVSRAYTAVDATSTDLTPAVALAERAVAADPQDANARLLRASLAFAQGRVADAQADLEVLDGLQRPTASFLFGGPEDLREQLDAATATTVPAAAPTTTDAPTGGPTTSVDRRIANPGGG
jgi:tetratricopeptide (TPR) repeat protein